MAGEVDGGRPFERGRELPDDRDPLGGGVDALDAGDRSARRPRSDRLASEDVDLPAGGGHRRVTDRHGQVGDGGEGPPVSGGQHRRGGIGSKPPTM
jgi:hypothetical protein